MPQPLATKEYLKTKFMYELTLPIVSTAFRAIERAVPPPQKVVTNNGWKYRFIEQLPQQAIAAKLARSVTGLQSIWLLLNAGMTQEAAAIQRMLDEIGSDVLFLSGPLTIGEETPSHKRFLSEFFQEEFDDDLTPLESTQKRDRVPRKKIRAYNANTFSFSGDPHTASKVFATIDGTYSGFVHAACVHVMDMFGGEPPHFCIEGLNGTSRVDDALADFRNYLHRCVIDMAFGAKAVGIESMFLELYEKSAELATRFDAHD